MNHPTTSHFASQAYAAAVTAGYEPRHLHHPSYPHQQFGYGYGNPAPSGPTPPVSMPQFSAGNDQGPALAHPQQHHLHQLNMQQAAFQRMMMQQQQQETEMLDSPMAAAVAGMASPSKKQQSKAERRAEHNAIERARRESLNSKFQQLAHALPNLQNDRRPSKGTIIERTLEYVKNTTQKDERYKHHIRQLRKENQMLRKQLKHEREMEARCQSSCSSIKSDIDDASFASMTPTPTDTASGMYHLQHAPSQQQQQSPAEVFSMGSGTSPYYEDPSDDDYSAHGDTDPIDVSNAICPPVSFSQEQYTNMVYMGDYMKAPVSMPPLSSDYHEVKIDMPRQQQ